MFLYTLQKKWQFRASTAASATPVIQAMPTQWATPSMGRRGGGRAPHSPGDWSTTRWTSPWISVRWDAHIFLCYKLLLNCLMAGCGGRSMVLPQALIGVVEWRTTFFENWMWLPVSTLPKHSHDPICSWSCISPGAGGHVNNAASGRLAKNQLHALFSQQICSHHDPRLLYFGSQPAEIAPPTSGILASRNHTVQNQIPLAQVETLRQRSSSLHVWHIWLPLGALSDNRFLSVFRWIKLTTDQARPNIVLAFQEGGHMWGF